MIKFLMSFIMLVAFAHFASAIQPFRCGKKTLFPFPTCGFVDRGWYHLDVTSITKSTCTDAQLCYCCKVKYEVDHWKTTDSTTFDKEVHSQCQSAF
ncbi:hypothetical protein PGT21_015526 [Puccinia graminis f. sp. tritici]|uniref:Uncharacterized protein n=1 Tax=Puccinia graminis f. sp. tritici TaxID=56615 RepID=A0A5B0PXM8_PUCGR|nr:hypothetical protein PGT21_015526 [Puccinia graminis f. sp. tritici]